MDIIVKRTNRTSIGIYIREGKVEVRAPYQCPQESIDKFLGPKMDWIQKHLATSQANLESRKNFVIDYGSEVLLWGQPYPIVAKEGNRAGFDGKVFYIPPGFDPSPIKELIIKTYTTLAKLHFKNRVAHFTPIMGLSPTGVKVNSAKTRWGSCSSKKTLNFSWRLIMASEYIIDYVIVHELAHIYEMNHSAKYWAVVERFMPDYKQRMAELKDFGTKLHLEDW